MSTTGVLAFVLSHWAILVAFALGAEAVMLGVAFVLHALGLSKAAHVVIVMTEWLPQAVSFAGRMLGRPVPSFAWVQEIAAAWGEPKPTQSTSPPVAGSLR